MTPINVMLDYFIFSEIIPLLQIECQCMGRPTIGLHINMKMGLQNGHSQTSFNVASTGNIVRKVC